MKKILLILSLLSIFEVSAYKSTIKFRIIQRKEEIVLGDNNETYYYQDKIIQPELKFNEAVSLSFSLYQKDDFQIKSDFHQNKFFRIGWKLFF